MKTGKIVAKTLHVAGDAGLIVYPEGSENNEQGAAIQGLSRAITEEVTCRAPRRRVGLQAILAAVLPPR